MKFQKLIKRINKEVPDGGNIDVTQLEFVARVQEKEPIPVDKLNEMHKEGEKAFRESGSVYNTKRSIITLVKERVISILLS